MAARGRGRFSRELLNQVIEVLRSTEAANAYMNEAGSVGKQLTTMAATIMQKG